MTTPISTGKARALAIVAGLKRAGIDLVSTLPDAWLGDVIAALAEDPAVTLIRVTREDEGLGICAGAFLGGRRAALVAQNAGLLLSANVLAGLAMHHQIPALVLAAQRGGPDDNQYYQTYKGRVTAPVLSAIGVPYHFVEGPEDFQLIERGWQQSFLCRMPVALLFTHRALFGEEAGA
jgi:sulfopyruvate decarboxylase subunit alpha